MQLVVPMTSAIVTYTWDGDDLEQYWEFFRRAIVKRQEEAIHGIIAMARAGHGHFGVTLLRPAYEELLWTDYLRQHAALAPKIALLMAHGEVGLSLEAQNQFLGAKVMDSMGFKQRAVKAGLAKLRKEGEELKAIGKQLGWRNDEPPGAAFLARQVSREREYNFIYQATSRYAHFSALELGRRVWGKKGAVTIGSNNFSDYWCDFAVYWSFRIFVELIAPMDDFWHGVELDPEQSREFAAFLKEIRAVPILTSRELQSW